MMAAEHNLHIHHSHQHQRCPASRQEIRRIFAAQPLPGRRRPQGHTDQQSKNQLGSAAVEQRHCQTGVRIELAIEIDAQNSQDSLRCHCQQRRQTHPTHPPAAIRYRQQHSQPDGQHARAANPTVRWPCSMIKPSPNAFTALTNPPCSRRTLKRCAATATAPDRPCRPFCWSLPPPDTKSGSAHTTVSTAHQCSQRGVSSASGVSSFVAKVV